MNSHDPLYMYRKSVDYTRSLVRQIVADGFTSEKAILTSLINDINCAWTPYRDLKTIVSEALARKE